MKTKQLFSLAALALMMAACSSDDIATGQSGAKVRTVPFKAVISADAGTRGLSEDGNTITVDWEKDEQVALVHGLNIDILKVESVDGGDATISGDITDPTNGESVFVVYAGHNSKAMTDLKSALSDYAKDQELTTYTEANINLILKNQFEPKVSGGSLDGMVESISQLVDHRLGSGALAVSDNGASFKDNVKLTTTYAIWKLSLSDGTNALKANELTIKSGDTKIAYIKSESGASDFYVPFAPASEASFAFEAGVGEDTYAFSKTGVTLKAGTYYRSTLTMTEVNNKYLVYDSSGKATATDIPSDATTITSTTTTWAKGTYVVSEDVTIAGDVTLSGDVNLILMDGVTLTVNGTIYGGPSDGNYYQYSLYIFGQSESTETMGTLSVKSGDSYDIVLKSLYVHGVLVDVANADQCIETYSKLNIYHGSLSASGNVNGIEALGDMNVYGGTIIAEANDASGIGINVGGTLTINNGEVSSSGGTGLSANTLVVNGGKLIAIGGSGYEGSGIHGAGVSDSTNIILGNGINMYIESEDPEKVVFSGPTNPEEPKTYGGGAQIIIIK